MKTCKIILAVAMIAASGPALTQTTTPNVVNPNPGLQNSSYLHYDLLHDELQFPGGELSNQVLRFGAADAPSRSQLGSPAYPQCHREHGMHHGLHLDPVGMPKRMRAEFTFSLENCHWDDRGLPMPEMVRPGDHCLVGSSRRCRCEGSRVGASCATSSRARAAARLRLRLGE